MPLVRIARKAARLPLSSWGTMARVFPVVFAVRVALWVLPYRIATRLFEPKGISTAPKGNPHSTLRVVAWTGRTFLRDRPCLTQAMAARWLLARDGYHTDLKIGAAMVEGSFRAHAWLEANGTVVLGGERSGHAYRSFRPLGPSDKGGTVARPLRRTGEPQPLGPLPTLGG